MMDKWRILIVDDSKELLELLVKTFSPQYDVMAVTSGEEALKVLNVFEPDLIILDILMPQTNGYEVLEAIKNNLNFTHTPVIILSAKDSIDDQKYGYRLGASAYITKPFTTERLVKNVNLIFERTPPLRQKKKYDMKVINQQVQLKELYKIKEKGF